MEMSRLLLLFMLVTVAYASGHKSERLMAKDACSNYARILKTDRFFNDKYFPCGVDDSEGNPICYLSSMKCDSVIDCPNNADEHDCKPQHQAYCATGFEKFKRNGINLEPFRCHPEFDHDQEDVICILTKQTCDRNFDCPKGDDEQNCQ